MTSSRKNSSKWSIATTRMLSTATIIRFVLHINCNKLAPNYVLNFQSMDKAKPKKGPFNGSGIISFPKTDSANGKFKHGMRFGKCLSLPPFLADARLLRISGKFVEDKLEGRVILEFVDEVITVGHAVDNRLVGVVRNFAVQKPGVVLQNITDAHGA